MNGAALDSFDAIVLGGGLMGCATALFLSREGMRTALIDRGELCRSASGVNAGTLTMHMTRAALIPYAMRGWSYWTKAASWLGHEVGANAAPGLCLAFADEEAELLEQRSRVRIDAGADIELITTARALEIEPGLSRKPKLVAHCAMDGHVEAYRTGHAFRLALVDAGCTIIENQAVTSIERSGDGYRIQTAEGWSRGRRLVLAGGVWLEPLLAMLGIQIPVKTLVNQLTVTERMKPLMRSVITIASGLLSLKQFTNGSIVIGGGWQGVGDRESGMGRIVPESIQGNARLAAFAIPELAKGRILRSWTGFEAETADAMPMLGPIPGMDDAFVIGSAHSGYTSGPCLARLLADRIAGREPELPLFPIDRLLQPERQEVTV